MTYHSGNQLVDPYLLFEKAHLQPGQQMADLGCGRTGHIIFPASKIIGEHGTIYAVDIMKDVLQNIQKRAQLDGIHNIHTVWGDIEKPNGVAIPAKSLDIVFLVNTLFHTKDASPMLASGARLCKDKARIVVVDWKNATLPFGPKQDQLVDFDSVSTWAQNNNFIVQEEFDVGRYHRGVVLYKND
jgi:ubiquinone/menaquinone biosynthesis C-methylase UbiE